MKSRGSSAPGRIDRRAVDRQPLVRRDRRSIVERPADPVEDAPEQTRADAEADGLGAHRHGGVGQAEPERGFQDLHDDRVVRDRHHAADACRSAARQHAHGIVQADIDDPLQVQQRPFQPRVGPLNSQLGVQRRSPVTGPRTRPRRSRSIAANCAISVLADLLADALQAPVARQRGDLLRACPGRQRRLGKVEEPHHQLQDRALPRGRTVAIDHGHRRLAQHGLVDQVRADQRQLLLGRQRVAADDPHHPLEARLLLEQREDAAPLLRPVGVAALLPPLRDRVGVLRIGQQRMDRGVEARLRALPVQCPERAHEAPRMHRDRLGEVAGRRADGADDRHRALAVAERAHARGALVELRQPRTEIGRIAGLARQFAEPARHLAQRLGPAAGGVGHQRDVQPLVAEVFGHRDRRVDARFARGDRHVRGVGDDHRAFEQRPPGVRVLQLRELVQHLGHLVAALAAADVDDHVGVAPLRERFLQHRLAGAEPAGQGGAAAARHREQQVEDALAGDQRPGDAEPLAYRPRRAHGPVVGHRHLERLPDPAPRSRSTGS